MSISNGYTDLATFKLYQTNTQDVDDVVDELAIETASRSIDNWTNRRFYLDAVATARTYYPTHTHSVLVDDIGAAGFILATDSDCNGTFDLTWSATDYQTNPPNAFARGVPVTGIQAIGHTWFPMPYNGRTPIQVTAQWGWPSVPMEIQQATLLLAARYKMRRASAEGVVGFSDFAVRVQPIDHDVQALINPYRRISF